jgi:hypothetical protein
LADKPTFGQKGKGAPDPKARENLARTQRGDFRKTASSNSGLHGYAHKATNPADKAKQDARGAQRGALTPNEKKQFNREEVDLFDYLLEYLVSEGYADTNDAAIAIMSNMSEEWRDSILDEKFISPYEGKPTYGNPQGHSPAMKALKKSDDLQKTELGSERQKKQTRRSGQLNKMFSAARRAGK